MANASLEILNRGIPPEKWSPFYGSQGTSVGKKDGKEAFIAEIAPWEGTTILTPGTVSVLLPTAQQNSLWTAPLTRVTVDVIGNEKLKLRPPSP